MTVDEPTRYELFRWFAEQMPDHLAEAMMKSIPPSGWGDVATRNDLTASGVLLRGEMAEVRGEMAEVRGEMAEVRGEMDALRAEVRGELHVIRGDMELGFAQLHRTIVFGAIASAVSSWGVAIAAVGLS